VKTTRRRDRGQSLVEFSLVLIPFLLILMGIIDLGRGIYTYNGVAQAARELARATSVHTCDTTKATCTLGTSPQTANVRGTQNTMVPGLAGASASVTYTCTNITDTDITGKTDPLTGQEWDDSVGCRSGSFVKVTVTVPFQVITPVLSMVAPTTLSSTTHVQIP
jgi:Flp pilus assembly protein TadG